MQVMALLLALTSLTSQVRSLQHSVVLAPDDGVEIHWTPDTDANSLVMRVEARTRGWAAVGFSPSGGMAGADIVMGWVSDGKVHVQDMFAERNEQPKLDAQSDVEVLGGSENGTHTVFTFRRPLRSCDTEHDVNLGMDTARLIWAMHESDPSDAGGATYHGSRRGVRSVSLDGAGWFRYPPPGASESFMVLHNGTALKEAETYYHCSIHKIPDFGDEKVHYTGFRVVLAPETRAYVHHIVMYECVLPEHVHESFEQFATEHPGAECYSANMPPPWTLCSTVAVVWAVGGEGEMLPEDVGLPLGHQHGGSTYFMMETHYDNPHKHTGLRDFSGVEMFYTRRLRPMEASVLTVGEKVSSSHIIPPGQTEFVSAGVCPGECTGKYFPKEGIRIHAVLLHAHLAGRTMLLRHIRNGKELTPLAHDNNYDFNYQQSRAVHGDVRILPGDSLVVECGYNTQDRQNVTLGGFGSRNEMCLAFITYYPRTSLSRCQSKSSLGRVMKNMGLKDVEITGLHLPVETAGEVWVHASHKFGRERAKTLVRKKNTTEATKMKKKQKIPTDGEDWFNRLELSSLNILGEKGSPSVGLYDYLQRYKWSPSVAEKIQQDALHGPTYAYCTDRAVTDGKHYAESMSGPWEKPPFEPVAAEPLDCAASSEALTGSSARSLGGAAVVALLALLALSL